MTRQAELLAYLFDGQPHLLSATMTEWMEASPRFTTFADTYRDKIRKKVRLAHQPESALDLRCELEVAYCLLSDRRLSVTYEPYASAKGRGPDFAVAYRANLIFNIEVARIRAERSEANGPADGSAIDLARGEERILRVLLDKLGQMQPGMANLLVIHTRKELAQSVDLGKLMQQVKTRAEGRDPALYASSRFASPSNFFKYFLRLSGILIWADEVQTWVNKQARPDLPEEVYRLLCSLAAGKSAN